MLNLIYRLPLLFFIALAAVTARADTYYATVYDPANVVGNVIKITENGTVTNFTTPGAMVQPEGIAFDQAGFLYVADQFGGVGNSPVIYKVDNTGNYTSFASIPSSGQVMGLAIDSQNNVFVTGSNVTNDNVIFKFNAAGNLAATWQFGYGAGPVGLAVDGADNLYVAEFVNNSVGVFTPSGVHSLYASLDTFDPNYFPYGLAFDHSGNLFVSGGVFQEDVAKILPGGTTIVPYITSNLSNATGLVVDSTGDLYINDGSCDCEPNTIGRSTGIGQLTVFANLTDAQSPNFITAVPEPAAAAALLTFPALLAAWAARRHKQEAPPQRA